MTRTSEQLAEVLEREADRRQEREAQRRAWGRKPAMPYHQRQARMAKRR